MKIVLVDDEVLTLGLLEKIVDWKSMGVEIIGKAMDGYASAIAVLFFNAFNNQWGTNFPQWISGSFKF